jgi:hypothetical protein
VPRAVLLVLLALLTFQVSGVALCDEATCEEDACPTDLSGGQCPPNCHYCSCCSFLQLTPAPAAALVAPRTHGIPWHRSPDRLPCPEPADILHVPKLSVI